MGRLSSDFKKTLSIQDALTPGQEIFVQRLGLSEWELVEPFGSLWKSRGKKLYVKHKRKNMGAIDYLLRQSFVKHATEAGGDNIIQVILH